MPTPEQKKKLLKAKIAVALHDELGRVPKEEEINQVFLLTRVMYKAVLGLHYKRQEQKKTGTSPKIIREELNFISSLKRGGLGDGRRATRRPVGTHCSPTTPA
jgi:hypothetical protein